MLDAFLAALAAVREQTPDDAEFLYAAETDAGALRLANLDRYLRLAATRRADTVLVAEAPGYRGMTVTGVPFTSLRELDAAAGYRIPAAADRPWELSASVVQKALRAWPGPAPVCWSVYPNHPFRAPDRATNRAPRPAEVRLGAPVALELLRAFRPRLVVAVGRKAQGALAAAGVAAVAVRHPAQGGAGVFAVQMRALHDDRG